jgi:hypothetical protein
VWPRGMSLESLATLLSQTRTEKLLAGSALKKTSKGRQEPAQMKSRYEMESLSLFVNFTIGIYLPSV